MATKATNEAITILKESLKELESPKGSVLTGVQKLLRAATILGNDKIVIWCEIQLGHDKYTEILKKYIAARFAYKNNKTEKSQAVVTSYTAKLEELGLEENEHYTLEEINVKVNEKGGGYKSIGFIEDKYAVMVKNKAASYVIEELSNHIYYVKRAANKRASTLYNAIAFSDTPQTCFDIMKEAVDDRLLDINPELAEQLMLSFKAVSTDKQEEWSQALTTCRRFIEKLADELYPPIDEEVNGRKLGKEQYINRIWAFMDESIASVTNKELAKSHVDYLGLYLQSFHKISCKGVHSDLERLEAVKAVFHIYLVVADILNYLDKSPQSDKQLNIYTATLDELQSFLNISKAAAKEIVKLRNKSAKLKPKDLAQIKGIGTKTIQRIEEVFSFDSER